MTATRTAKETISLISKQQLCTCSTLALFNISFPLLLQRETSSLHVLWKKNVACADKKFCCLYSFFLFFFSAARFSPCWLLEFHIFLNSSPLLFIARSSSMSLSFSLSFASLSRTFSFSLSVSFSKFQIWGYDN